MSEAEAEDIATLRRHAEEAYFRGDLVLVRRISARMRRAPEGVESADMLDAQLRFGGDHYIILLERLFDLLRPRTYVEIGVEHGTSLRLVKPPTLAIGIDPDPKIQGELASHQKLFRQTSDEFFATRDLRAELGGLPVDLAFIDGMHQFEFALRDFANLERCSERGSTILIHDCYPLDRETAERERHRAFWSGDIWRAILLLKKHRPDLSIHTIGTAPTGLAVVRNLDPASTLLSERHDELCREFLAVDYASIEHDMPGKLNLFPNDWARIRALLG